MHKHFYFTSESVTEGHPDKICDQISDAILDEVIKQDSEARVACEVLISTGLIVVAGEITSEASVDYEKIVKDTILEIGYDKEAGFDVNECRIIVSIDEQSSDISQGVTTGYEKRMGLIDDAFSGGAGDQGIMFGYANDETDSFMPAPIYFAHQLSKQLTIARKTGIAKSFLPDGKTQVTVEYENGKPVHIDTVVISTQHKEQFDLETVKQEVLQFVIQPVLPDNLYDEKTKVLINPTGRFVIGGPVGDTGLTGRKIVVDTYGGYSKNGGGALSGKDPTKVDRSASYMARYLAKNIVASELAEKCEVQLAYAIGVAEPVSIFVDTFGTGRVAESEIEHCIENNFDLRPEAIIHHLQLRKPIYQQTASYGHFGRENTEFPWEKVDQTKTFSELLK